MYPELSVEKVYNLIKSDQALLSYLPDLPKAIDDTFRRFTCDRKFFWSVIATLRPTFYEQVMEQAKIDAALDAQRMLQPPPQQQLPPPPPENSQQTSTYWY